ncbi:MAG: hypothetical protein HQL20_07665 [Candidatus Omnitrophica bacterium]|nr:hypothetical protein [Candidatus Omnitrophota bacterium]
MSKYILTSRGLCTAGNSKVEWLSLDDFAGLDHGAAGELVVLLSEVEYRRVGTTEGLGTISTALPGGFVVRQERLKGSVSMVMGVREDTLHALYDGLPRNSLKVCVPYGLAVRAFLLARGLVLDGAAYIVVDDARERVFITLIDGSCVLETRELVYQDGERLADEVKRSEKWLGEYAESRGPVKVVTNHKAYFDLAVKQHGNHNIISYEGLLPVLAIMDKARFGVNFPSPENEAANIKREALRRVVLKLVLPFLLMAGAVIFAWYMSAMVVQAGSRLDKMSGEVIRRQGMVKERALLTYQDRLRTLRTMSWEGAFLDLLDSLPAGWSLQSVGWEADLQGKDQIAAFVLKGEEGEFKGRGIFKRALVVNELFSGRPALRITYRKDKSV